jgi:hypothetical protein
MSRAERPIYETKLPRAVLGSVFGALVGVAIIEAMRIGPLAFHAVETGLGRKSPITDPTSLAPGLIDSTVYAVLILVLAVAIWRVLGMSRLQGWRSALALGFGLTFLVWWVGGMRSEDVVPRQPIVSAALFGVAGAVAALAAWKVAYRRRFIPWVLTPVGPGGFPGSRQSAAGGDTSGH